VKALIVLAVIAGVAHADDVDLQAMSTADDSPWPTLELGAAARARAGYLYNFDLDRGLTPSGQPLFPVPDESAQAIAVRDLRLRGDLTVRSRGGTMDLKLRLDVTDDGSVDLRRAYGELLTPLGVLVAGRMPNQFGLGIAANSGDCLDCDGGATSNRVGLVTPVRGYFVAAALDLASTATGQLAGSQPHAATLAIVRMHGDAVRAIRRRGGRTTVDFGGALAYVWQDSDTPAEYLLADPGPDPATMHRGLDGVVGSSWLRFEQRALRIEAEADVVAAGIEQPSLVPGLLLREPVQATQLGAALESELGAPDGPYGAGVDAGYASGDPAPGFGAFPTLANAAAQPGDLDGSQARPPTDHRIDNFRFDPNYRIDRILFHQIIGTVTDAVYVRPHARARLLELGPGTIGASVAAIASWAIEPTSTPSGQRRLGLELDSDLAYRTRDGFVARIAHAVLLPGPAFDGPMLPARPAQTIELLVGYAL